LMHSSVSTRERPSSLFPPPRGKLPLPPF
jgi:hypothetical protein